MNYQRIIYSTTDGGIAIIIPTGEVSLEEVIVKDVPAGLPYAIVDAAEIPEDRTFRDAWTANFEQAAA